MYLEQAQKLGLKQLAIINMIESERQSDNVLDSEDDFHLIFKGFMSQLELIFCHELMMNEVRLSSPDFMNFEYKYGNQILSGLYARYVCEYEKD